jgi:glycosidase
MKRICWLIIGVALLLTSCKNKECPKAEVFDWHCGVVYEMNVRQYTPEGTLKAAEAHLPRLKELGVDIVWLMPIHPIGVEGRKGSLGSYYAPRNYKEVNPEFGTVDDLVHFVETAHGLDMYVILDWVANHTSPDSEWMEQHLNEWFLLDSLGHPVVQYDWTDIAPLDWVSPPKDMCDAMEDAMLFWLKHGVDGFRCDVAHQIPVSFWKPVFDRFRSEFPGTYYLAEGERPDLQEAFDVTYAWELFHMMNNLAQGKDSVISLARYIVRDDSIYGAVTHPDNSASSVHGSMRLMFTSNHDENSWSGTEMERMGKFCEPLAVLTFTLPHSQPLIYTGQEVGFDHRFQFFEKDKSPQWIANNHTAFYSQMTALRHAHPALRPEAPFELIEACPDSTFAFLRFCEDDTVSVFVNLSHSSVEWQGEIVPAAGWKVAF